MWNTASKYRIEPMLCPLECLERVAGSAICMVRLHLDGQMGEIIMSEFVSNNTVPVRHFQTLYPLVMPVNLRTDSWEGL